MKSIHCQNISRIHLLIVVLMLTSNTLHCGDGKRQARITALLNSYQASKPTKAEGLTQKLLDVEKAECERKESVDRLPMATLARAGATSDISRNKTFG